MCGIAGWFDINAPDQRAHSQLNAMIDAIAHRGPDGRGSQLVDNAALGHTRLAIIDVDGGAQPLMDSDRRAVIVFNGEIYNFRELRGELLARGQRLDTQSDTETVLGLYLNEGTRGLSRLRGMYAFAIWDLRRRCGVLARDPLGIKPLFLHRSAARVVFGSEAKALLAAGVPGQLDEASLHLLLNFRYLPGQRSMFRNIEQLPPGVLLSWTPDGRISESRIEEPEPWSIGSEPALPLVDRVRSALAESVAAHLVADVQVGAYLSGGIDSAAVVAMAKNASGGQLPTFTLDIGDDPAEAANAARTAELLGVDNRLAAGTRSPADTLYELIHQLEMPKVNAWQVSELARHAARNVKVVLSGLGGDELFYGYNMHSTMQRADSVGRIPSAVRRPAGALVAALMQLRRTPWTETQRMALMFAAAGDWPRVYGLLRNLWDSPSLRRKLYGPRLLDQSLPDAFTELAARWPKTSDPVAAAARFEWREKMVNDLLWQEDRVSMAHGLEVRVPFVDVALKQRLADLDRATLMPNGRRKGLMRDSLRTLLPSEVLSRPKSGFQVDAGRFWRELEPLAATWLSDTEVRRHGLFNPNFIRRMRAAEPRTGLRWHFFLLYLMLGAHLWMHHFEGKALR